MQSVITAVARVIAMEAGAELRVLPGTAHNTSDRSLSILAEALLRQMAGTGVDLLSVERHGTRLVAEVDDSEAEEPLCPAAFRRVVRKLSYDLLGEAWDGELMLPAEPAGVPEKPAIAPWQSPLRHRDSQATKYRPEVAADTWPVSAAS